MQRTDTQSNLKYFVVWAILGAVAYVLMHFMQIPLLTPFTKFDASDALVALSTFIFGPVSGIMIALVRTLVSLALSPNIFSLIGQVAAFLATVAYVLPAYYLIKSDLVQNKRPGTGKLIVGLVLGALALTAVMTLANGFVLTPMYIKAGGFSLDVYNGSMMKYLLSAIVPFNLIKGLLNGILVAVLSSAALKPIRSFVQSRF